MKTYIGDGKNGAFFNTIVWEDENFDILAARVPGNNNLPTPVLAPGTGVPYPSFPNSGITEFIGHKEYNHAAANGHGVAAIRPHFHWMPSNTDTGNLKIFFEYRIIFGSAVQTGVISAIQAANGAAWIEQRKEIGIILLDEGVAHIGAQIGFRFYRSAADPEDTYGGTAIFCTAGWHFPINSAGSRSVFEK